MSVRAVDSHPSIEILMTGHVQQPLLNRLCLAPDTPLSLPAGHARSLFLLVSLLGVF
jgi:hypothetical protein